MIPRTFPGLGWRKVGWGRTVLVEEHLYPNSVGGSRDTQKPMLPVASYGLPHPVFSWASRSVLPHRFPFHEVGERTVNTGGGETGQPPLLARYSATALVLWFLAWQDDSWQEDWQRILILQEG